MVFGRKQRPTEMRHPNELPVPGAAFDVESTEIFRAWIVGQGLQVSLQMGFKDPSVWGILLVDIARHAARIYEAEGVMSQEDALAAIRSMSDAEWNNMTDPGTTGQARQ